MAHRRHNVSATQRCLTIGRIGRPILKACSCRQFSLNLLYVSQICFPHFSNKGPNLLNPKLLFESPTKGTKKNATVRGVLAKSAVQPPQCLANEKCQPQLIQTGPGCLPQHTSSHIIGFFVYEERQFVKQRLVLFPQ